MAPVEWKNLIKDHQELIDNKEFIKLSISP